MSHISSADAKALLGCDDATLQNYIANGTIRASRDGGQLMVLREDVENLMGVRPSDSDDGTIILSGDSEDLSIDLGEVVDDSSVTMVQADQHDATGTDSITFGDELEVVNFDDGNTAQMAFDDTDVTQDLNFTDSNTSVQTGYDETVVATGEATATGTATSDFQTVDYGETSDDDTVNRTSLRRSVRSQRNLVEAQPIHPLWPVVLVLSAAAMLALVIPYPILSWVPQDDFYASGGQKRGAADSAWTRIASSFAGFSAEPDRATFVANAPPGQADEWVDISVADPSQPSERSGWRFRSYRGKHAPEERPKTFVIGQVEMGPGPDGEQVPTSARSLDENGNVLETFPIQQHRIDDDSPVQYRPQVRFDRQ